MSIGHNLIHNPKWTEEQQKSFTKKVVENEGYCPCSLAKTRATLCVCSNFVDILNNPNIPDGTECHCGRFIKSSEGEL